MDEITKIQQVISLFIHQNTKTYHDVINLQRKIRTDLAKKHNSLELETLYQKLYEINNNI